MDTDTKILKCINKMFKSCRVIAEETGLSPHRVSIRMLGLRQRGLVYEVQGQSEGRGTKPLKYKLRKG